MAHPSSPHSPLSSPPRYEKSSINQRNNTLRYDQRDPAPRYSSKNTNSYRAEAAHLNGLLGTSADDKLPPYAPTLQLLTLCRRKNELDAKDRKAKKRSWDLVWLLLDGTALRMYQPTTAETKKFQKEWNEKYCKKGPVKKPVVVVDPVEQEEDEEVETDEEVEVEEVLDVHSTLVEETRATRRPSHCRGRSSSTAKTPFESTPSPSSSRSAPAPTRIRASLTMPSPTSPLHHSPTSPSPLTLTRPALTLPPHPSLPTILTRKPSISHAVRNISCTRATTYFKRHFVLRFILEDGKQFLVQLNSHEETLVWQQSVTIAAPLALDIDERDMPEPAPYPRQRRRTTTTTTPTATTTPTLTAAPTPTTTPARTPTLVRRPSTAPGAIDTTRIPNVPPGYETCSPAPASASTTHADAGMRRRRSFSGL